MIDLVLERGYEATTAEMVAVRAGVSVSVFERYFTDIEDCFMQIFWRYVGVFKKMVWGAYESEDNWRDALRAAAYAAALYCCDFPRQARFGSIQLLGVGPLAEAHLAAFLQEIVDLIDAGRQEMDEPDSISRAVAEAVLGSVYGGLTKRMRGGKNFSPMAAVPELMYIAVRPYLGDQVARQELKISPPLGVGQIHA